MYVYSYSSFYYNFLLQCFLFGNVSNDVQLSTGHVGSHDVSDLLIHSISFLVLLCFGERFLFIPCFYQYSFCLDCAGYLGP